LNLIRLNAYRSHFGLSNVESEQVVETEVEPKSEIESKSEVFYDQGMGGDFMEEVVHGEVDEAVDEFYEEVIEEFIDDPKNEIEEIYTEELIEEAFDEDEKQITENEKFFTFQCHICDNLIFSQFRDLQNHTKNVHNALPQVACCSQKCGKILSTWRRLMIHKEKHFPSPSDDVLRCEQCYRIFTTEAGFEKHKKVESVKKFKTAETKV
jgi:hypothetical protein